MRIRWSSQQCNQQGVKVNRESNQTESSLKTSLVTMPSEGGITFNSHLLGSPPERRKRQRESRRYNARQLDALAVLKSSDVGYQNLEIEDVECDYQLTKAKQTMQQLEQQLWETSKPLAILQGQIGIHEGIIHRKEALIRVFCDKLAAQTDIPSISVLEKELKQETQEYRLSSQDEVSRINSLCLSVVDQQTQMRRVNEMTRLQVEQIQQKTIQLQNQALERQKRNRRKILAREELVAKKQIYQQQKSTLDLKCRSLEAEQKALRSLFALEEQHSSVIGQLEDSIKEFQAHRVCQQNQRRLAQTQEMGRLIPSVKQSIDQLTKENSKLKSRVQEVNKVLWRLKESLHRITHRQTGELERS